MREIKFRAWLPDYELMIGENFDGVDDLQLEDVRWDLSCGIAAIYVDEIFDRESGGDHIQGYEFKLQKDAVIMQFTGLKDKNGVDIYEGGIVNHPDIGIGYIDYNDKHAAYKIIFKGTTRKWLIDMIEREMRGIEVIGNIHENPELLENK